MSRSRRKGPPVRVQLGHIVCCHVVQVLSRLGAAGFVVCTACLVLNCLPHSIVFLFVVDGKLHEVRLLDVTMVVFSVPVVIRLNDLELGRALLLVRGNAGGYVMGAGTVCSSAQDVVMLFAYEGGLTRQCMLMFACGRYSPHE